MDPSVDAPETRTSVTDIIVDRRWVLLLAFALCGLAGYLGSMLMRPAFKAEALVLPLMSADPSSTGGSVA